MNSKDFLLGALKYYNIEIIKNEDNHITIFKDYVIEIETNGLFKLKCDGQVIAPFDDIDELCRFVLL
ncbi:hypothetical protein [Sediminibacterium sp.]|jgi:hypothetical protein|uniref:hypothetical protein n=1 Tax=Sediminibacterium sp. TaxID=1917865 RepID=UPI0027249147|nr:hypothetical protein [Sediminibacterium sp.]MDO8995690.1 hypothetical protein [Sediminibacterium sp.]MDP2422332.1 hypothetical protein [Sediminibacterium sp.]